MKFLVDEAVSWQVARDLCAQGHDAVHVGDLGLSAAKDAVVLDRALAEDRVRIRRLPLAQDRRGAGAEPA